MIVEAPGTYRGGLRPPLAFFIAYLHSTRHRSQPVPPVALAHDALGSGLPWVFLHGFPLTRKLWEPQHALARDARLVLPDLRGFGASPRDGPHTMEAMAQDVLALCDRAGAARFGVVGLSMGGYVALQLHRLAVHRVAALVLADTQANADTPDARAGRETLARKVEGEGGMPALLDAFLPKLLSPEGQRNEHLVSRVKGLVLSNEPEPMAAALRGMGARPDMAQHLRTIACPVLALVGELDAVTPPEKAYAIDQAVVRGRVAVLQGAGHLSNLERPDAFNQALRGFMAEVAPELAIVSEG